MYEDRSRYLANGIGWCPNTVAWKAVVDLLWGWRMDKDRQFGECWLSYKFP
jgi:hypothetical protein